MRVMSLAGGHGAQYDAGAAVAQAATSPSSETLWRAQSARQKAEARQQAEASPRQAEGAGDQWRATGHDAAEADAKAREVRSLTELATPMAAERLARLSKRVRTKAAR